MILSNFLILGPQSVLQRAIDMGNMDIVKYLISKGVDLDAKGLPDRLDHLNPMVMAYRDNNQEIVELLRNAGADPRKLDDYIKFNPQQNNCCTIL